MQEYSGTIIKSTGSWYMVEDEAGRIRRGRLRGKFKLDLEGKKITNPIAVGDRVTYVEELGGEDTVAITQIGPRENYIIRRSVHNAHQSHMLAANLDQALLIATLAMPRTSFGFIDRFLVTAESFRIPVTVVLNKADLYGEAEDEILDYMDGLYKSLGYGFLVTSAPLRQGLEGLHEVLDQSTTLVAGHSGVGKSSLVNALVPDLQLRTGEISNFANKGTHTTTFAERHRLWEGSYIIDTPGIKELGLVDVAQAELSHYFPEMRQRLNQCRYDNCLHLHEPGCAVEAAVRAGDIYLSRYESYLSMLSGQDNRR